MYSKLYTTFIKMVLKQHVVIEQIKFILYGGNHRNRYAKL